MDITPKTPWKERRIKSGSFLDRKLSADILKVRRAHDINIKEIEKKTEYSAFMVAVCMLLALVMMIVFSGKAHAETIDPERLATAIYHAEGIHSKHPYGILARYHSTSPRQACLNTIRHRLRLWNGSGSFIVFLSKTYCPIGAFNDPEGLNKNWVKNVSYFYYERG